VTRLSRRRLLGTLALGLAAAPLAAACGGAPAAPTAEPAKPTAAPPTAAATTAPAAAQPTATAAAAAAAKPGPEGTTAPKPTEAPKPAAPAGAAPKAGGAPITLVQWDFCEGPCEVVEPSIKQTIENFRKENPNVTIQLEMLNFDAGPQKFEVALRSGTPPDVYHWAYAPSDFTTGLLVDLTPWVTKEDIDDILPGPLNEMKYKGKFYHWATYVSVWSLQGNKQILEDNKVDWQGIQKKGWTTDEFVEICTKLTKPPKQWGFVWADQYTSAGNIGDNWTYFAKNWGLPHPITDDGKWIFEGEGAVQSMQFLLDTYQKHKISPPETPGLKRPDGGDMFNRGEAVIHGNSGVWALSNRTRANADIKAGKVQGPTFDAVLLPWPHSPKHPEVGWIAPFGIRAWRQKDYKGDTQTEMAAKYTRMRSIDESNFEPELIGVLPARKSSDETIVKSGKHPLLADGGAHYQFAQRYGNQIGSIFWQRTMEPQVANKVKEIQQKAWGPINQAIIAGQKTPEQGVQELNQQAKAILAAP
jgi:multiple sugar transport system substrate-binding protein